MRPLATYPHTHTHEHIGTTSKQLDVERCQNIPSPHNFIARFVAAKS